MAIRNFPTFFWKRFEEHKERVAFVQASSAGVEPVTFWQWTRDVQKLAMGLYDEGFEAGDRIAILSPSRRHWLDVAFAAWLIGGVVVPLVKGRNRKETLRCLARAGCGWIAADSHETLDEVRGQGDKLPGHLRWISFDALRVGSPAPNTLEVPGLVESGRDLLRRGKLDKIAERTYGLDQKSPALLLYPLEPGDDPHAAFFGGGKLAVMLESLGADLQLEEDDRLAPLVSPGWLYGTLVTIATLLQGRTVVTAARFSELEGSFNELQPTVLLTGPAWIEGQSLAWQKRIEQAPDFMTKNTASGPLGLGKALSAIGSSAAKSVLYDPIRRSLGGNLRRAYLAGGKAPDEVRTVLDEIGVPLLGIFGLPECGVSHLERSGARRPGSVGRPVQGYVCKLEDAKLSETGEVLIRSDVLFDGYWDEQGPRAMEDGYLRTGLEGRIESGFLFIE